MFSVCTCTCNVNIHVYYRDILKFQRTTNRVSSIKTQYNWNLRVLKSSHYFITIYCANRRRKGTSDNLGDILLSRIHQTLVPPQVFHLVLWI